MNPFQHMIDQLNKFPAENNDNTITKDEYEDWKGRFSFDALFGLRYGQSFCNQFNITDNILYYEDDIDRCNTHILKHYIIK